MSLILTFQATTIYAKTGDLFKIYAHGGTLGQTISFELCLDISGSTPLSCQNYTTEQSELTIYSTIPNNNYSYAGTKINTPGFVYKAGPTANGYSLLGQISDTQGATGTFIAETAFLTISPSTLGLSVTGVETTTGFDSGTPRVFTLKNIGSTPATGVNCPSITSPSITSITCSGCGTILSGNVCTVTIQPSATASAAVADTNPTPITLTIQGENTNKLTPSINVLTYGSFYQSGYVFSIIETQDPSLSIGGTVAAERDASMDSSIVVNIMEVPYSPAWLYTFININNGYDGSNTKTGNTYWMVRQYSYDQNYSAGLCIPPFNSVGGYTDWYLPAICQMGYGATDSFDCGGDMPGTIPNIQYYLLYSPRQSGQNINISQF